MARKPARQARPARRQDADRFRTPAGLHLPVRQRPGGRGGHQSRLRRDSSFRRHDRAEAGRRCPALHRCRRRKRRCQIRDIAGAALAGDRRGLLSGARTPPRLPAVLVWLGAEAATDSVAPQAGAYQHITATLIAAPNSTRGTGARDPMARLVARTRAALNGWRPVDSPGQRDTLALRRGRLTTLDGARALWQDEYRISRRASACPRGDRQWSI